MKTVAHTFREKITSQSFTNFIKILSVDSFVKVSGIVLLPIYLKLMSQEEFGLYGYLIAMVVYLGSFLNGGLYLIQSKMYFEYAGAERAKLISTLNILLFLLLILCGAILVIFDFDNSLFLLLFNHPFDYRLFRIPLLTGILSTAFSLMVTHYLLASRAINSLQVFNIARTVLIHTSALSFLYFLPNVEGSFIRVSASYYTELFILICFVALSYKSFTIQFSFAIAKRAITYAVPITVYVFFSLIIFISDRYFIEQLCSRKDLAIYNLALVLAGVIPFISNSAHSIWLPELLQETDSRRLAKKARAMALKLFIGFSIVSVLIIATVKCLLAVSIIEDKYEQVIPILPFILLGSMLLSIFQLTFNYMLSISKIWILVCISICVCLLAIWIPRVLVANWGVNGAGASMVILNLFLLVPSTVYCINFYRQQSAKISA